MNYIILAAGEGVSSFSQEKQLPKCLYTINNKTILDNALSICKDLLISDITVVGGFEILKVMQKYPNLKYFYNEKWENSTNLYSLSKAVENSDDDILVSYSDILHTNNIIQKLIANADSINIAYDSCWKNRYEGRNNNQKNIEKIFNKDDTNIFTKEQKSYPLLGEFAGLLYIPKHKTKDLFQVIQIILQNDSKATLLDLLNHFSNQEKTSLIDIKGNWAELDSKQDFFHFKFGTKAETLSSLKNKISISKILEQFTFTVEEFLYNRVAIINKIQTFFNSDYLIIRSSALNEDTHDSSMAGSYTSILKVPRSNTVSLTDAISEVISSYTKNRQDQDQKNQILVQPYLDDVSMSGVVFTKDLQTSSPYYMINYDVGEDTESVTSGKGNNLHTFICYRNFITDIKDSKLEKLINAVRELEQTTYYDAIDVEFAFVKNTLYILQVRPIAAQKDSLKVLEQDVEKEIINLRSYIDKDKQKHPYKIGNKKAYGVMPDWNPAEIIGINPKPLAFDLYKYLITDNVWAKSRGRLGYRDLLSTPGLISFAGKPYVDINMSFNSYIPHDIEDKVSEKLIDFFIDKLQKNPFNHDKVEFEIAITAYDFNFFSKQDELLKSNFTSKEIQQITKAYKTLTEDIINQNNLTIESELIKTKELTIQRNRILSSDLSIPDKIVSLLESCKTYGTLPFSNLARYSFISSAFLKSLLSNKSISQDEYDNFLQSIHTVAKSFIDDLKALKNGQMTKQYFIKEYGHLRPGTYDITSDTYRENFNQYIDLNKNLDFNEKAPVLRLSSSIREKVTNQIKKHNLNFTADRLLEFMKESIQARERSKFEFTKNISVVLDLICEFANEFNLSKEDTAFLNINDILKYTYLTSNTNIEAELKKSILINKHKHTITTAIKLPELIFSKKDIDSFFYSQFKPNFITQYDIVASVATILHEKPINLEGRIVLIEHADPGFDWIFSHNIKALITKYGGAASHMSIRCAEFDLPAAIGCGDKLFNMLIKSKTIHLDCLNHKVESLS